LSRKKKKCQFVANMHNMLIMPKLVSYTDSGRQWYGLLIMYELFKEIARICKVCKHDFYQKQDDHDQEIEKLDG
jgi:hypothetical protein